MSDHFGLLILKKQVSYQNITNYFQNNITPKTVKGKILISLKALITYKPQIHAVIVLLISSSQIIFPPALPFWSFHPRKTKYSSFWNLRRRFGSTFRRHLRFSGHLRCLLNFTILSNYSWPIIFFFVVSIELGSVWRLIFDQKVLNSFSFFSIL